MPLRSSEYQRGYDAGYKQALLDAIKGNVTDRQAARRERPELVKLGGPDSRFKPRGIHGSIYNTEEDEERIRNPFKIDGCFK